MIDWQRVRERMIQLEQETPQRPDDPDEVSVEVVLARLLGLDDSEAEALGAHVMEEVRRVGELMQGHYRSAGLALSPGNYMAVGFQQGLTFAVAFQTMQEEDA